MSHLNSRRLFGLLISVLSVSACSNGQESVSAIREGQFLSTAFVEGLQFDTGSTSGRTGEQGAYQYQAGEQVELSIGDVVLPRIPASAVVTPLDVFMAEESSQTDVVNLTRLLSALDEDANPANGIQISQSAHDSATGLNVDFSSGDFDNQVINWVANSGSTTTQLPNADQTLQLLTQSLQTNGLITSGCGSDHRYVGRTAEFSTFFHNVSGSLTVLDNCTIEITNFNYDGLGPSVFFYAGNDRQYNRDDVFILGSRLNGTVWINDTIRLTLEEGQTLDSFNSISVWCIDFNANFGDAFFGDA